MKLKDIAKMLGGEVLGDPETEILGVKGIEEASGGDITFISGRKYLSAAQASGASCIMTGEFVEGMEKAQLKVADPRFCFAKLLEHFHARPKRPTGISPLAFVGGTARIGEEVSIYPFAYISEGVTLGKGSTVYPGAFIGEGTSVGEGTVIHPNVVVREGVKIGNRVIINSGAVIGSDGFGYTPHEGRHYKIPQVGGVIIGDNVEIGANTTIDRATTGNTEIGSGTKIDNLVQIGHNVKIGPDSIIVAQAGIAGSARMGKGVILGGQAGVADHAVMEDGVLIVGRSGVHGTLKKGVYSGLPAMPHKEWLRASVVFQKLPEMHKKLLKLEEKIKELQRGRIK